MEQNKKIDYELIRKIKEVAEDLSAELSDLNDSIDNAECNINEFNQMLSQLSEEERKINGLTTIYETSCNLADDIKDINNIDADTLSDEAEALDENESE